MPYFNIELVGERIRDFFSGLGDRLVATVSTEWWIALTYILFVILLLWLIHMTQKNYFRVLQNFVMEIDQLVYRCNRIAVLYNKTHEEGGNSKQHIGFLHADSIIKSENPNYIQGWLILKEEIKAAENVLQQKIVSVDERAKLYRLKKFIQRMHSLYKGLVGVLSVLTLGLYWLGHKKLHF